MRAGVFRTGRIGTLAVAGILMAAAAQAAGPYDGSVPLLCALIDVMECETGSECRRRPAESVNLPPFLVFDVTGRLVSAGDGSSRTAPIQHVERADGRVLLQGGQEGRAWSAAIAHDTGKLSAGVVDGQGAFVLFGVCTAR